MSRRWKNIEPSISNGKPGGKPRFAHRASALNWADLGEGVGLEGAPWDRRRELAGSSLSLSLFYCHGMKEWVNELANECTCLKSCKASWNQSQHSPTVCSRKVPLAITGSSLLPLCGYLSEQTSHNSTCSCMCQACYMHHPIEWRALMLLGLPQRTI